MRQKFDANHGVIVDAFQKMGATTQDIHANRAGVPDLVVGYRGKNFLVEVKVEKTGRLSEAQKKWRDEWHGIPPYVVKNVSDVVSLINLWGL